MNGFYHYKCTGKQRGASSDATLPNISSLLASGSFPAKVLTSASYAYISVDCVDLFVCLRLLFFLQLNVVFMSHVTPAKICGKLHEKHKTLPKKKTQYDLGFSSIYLLQYIFSI